MGRRILAAGSTPMQAWAVPVNEIVVDLKSNYRFGTYTEEDCKDIMQDLTDNIGIEFPVLCRPLGDNRLQLVAGYRRYCAVKYWNSHHPPSMAARLPVVVRDMNEEEAAYDNVRANVHQRDFTEMDMTIGIDNLLRMGRTETEIAASYGRSIDWVGEMRQLLKLDRTTQLRVHSGEITSAEAIEMAMTAKMSAS